MNPESPHPPHPNLRRILPLHAAGVALLGSGWALVYLLPFLARKDFDAGKIATWVLTAAVPVMQFFSVFWNHVYARIRPGAYFLIVALLACLPIAAMGAAPNIHAMLICFVLAAFAGAGGGTALSPINADILRTCYPDATRGRAYGIIAAAQFVGVMVFGQIMGEWSDRDPTAYRLFLPLTAALMAVGLVLLWRVASAEAIRTRPRPKFLAGEAWFAPLRDMKRILREDRRFFIYETAFQTYGIGWMICTALMPLIGEDQLRLQRADFAFATVTVFQLTMIVLLAPAGRLSDRIGATRMASASFLWLMIYPLGLIVVCSPWSPLSPGYSLGAVTVLYGIGMVGVHLSWTLGPVAFAPDAERAPHYLAIHGTLVGVRAILFQGLGVGLYHLTGRFWPALLIAGTGFALASLIMRRITNGRTPPSGL